jgi:hypothetical protein
VWDEGGLNAAWHVEQVISTDITPLDASEVFVPGFLILFFHLRQFHETMKAADGLDKM